MSERDPYGSPVVNGLQFRVSLTDFDPVVWRRVLVPDAIALPKLHRVIQQLMLWWNCPKPSISHQQHTMGVGAEELLLADWRRIRLHGPSRGVIYESRNGSVGHRRSP